MVMIDKVAEAIRRTNAETSGLTFNELSEQMAIAAIQAIREPTGWVMVRLHYGVKEIEGSAPCLDALYAGYQCAIDAMLSDSE